MSLKWSKTNQTGSEQFLVPLVTLKESGLCPFTAFLNMKYKLGVFYKGKLVLKQGGLDPSLISTHSFRRGGASFAFKSRSRFRMDTIIGRLEK